MSQVQSPIASTTPDALRAAIAEAVQVDAQQLQSAVGSIQVATSEQLQVTDPQIKSLYDADSRTLTLLADRIPAGQEGQAFAESLLEHIGWDAAENILGPDAAEKLEDAAFARAEQRRQAEWEEEQASSPIVVWEGDGWQMSDDGQFETKTCVMRLPASNEGFTFAAGTMTSQRGGEPDIATWGAERATREEAIADATYGRPGRLCVGLRVQTLCGELDTDELGKERQTPAGTWGKISDHNHADHWNVSFPNGAWIVVTEAELNDASQYLLLDERKHEHIKPATTMQEYRDLLDQWRALDGTLTSDGLDSVGRAMALSEWLAVSEAMDGSPFGLNAMGRLVEIKPVKLVLAADFAKTHACDPDWVQAMGNKDVLLLESGTTGTYEGFEATVLRHYHNGMYEISLPGGAACVSGSEFCPAGPDLSRNLRGAPREYKDPSQVYSIGSDDTGWNAQVHRLKQGFEVRVFDADGERRPDREHAFADKAVSIAFADRSVMSMAQRQERQISNPIDECAGPSM